MEKKAVIIGAGLGGLLCGEMLSRSGFKVFLVEKQDRPGGCLQTFRRGGMVFDCGFHYVGGMGPGEPLGRIFDSFSLGGLPFVRMDPECSDEVTIGNDTFCIPSDGPEALVEKMSGYFPSQKDNLERYAAFLSKVGDGIFGALSSPGMNPLFAIGAKDWLEETISDPVLCKVLTANAMKMELSPSLPLYTFAQINSSFMMSSWRLMGGGDSIVTALCDAVRDAGGEIILGNGATRIISDGQRVTSVELSSGETIPCDVAVADTHPAVAMALAENTEGVRKIYRRRISSLESTCGMFTVNVVLKRGSLPYVNHNLFVHSEDADMWNPARGKVESVMVHFYPEGDHLDIMTPMDLSEVSRWADQPLGHRGEGYEEFKRSKAEECICLAQKRIPGLREAIDRIYTSTPLTWRDYTGSADGSAYGVRKDFTAPEHTLIPSRTPLPGFFLTGQSLNLHGILGVGMTALLTCREILGGDAVRIAR
ncbi:MAG: NAD(P)/FAD-dependent oxidoreductase [Bacteroidales bacterium]|nr:NAD(P)/FAD-dependent oxidoreductase [Bacteroidales bacterium]